MSTHTSQDNSLCYRCCNSTYHGRNNRCSRSLSSTNTACSCIHFCWKITHHVAISVVCNSHCPCKKYRCLLVIISQSSVLRERHYWTSDRHTLSSQGSLSPYITRPWTKALLVQKLTAIKFWMLAHSATLKMLKRIWK